MIMTGNNFITRKLPLIILVLALSLLLLSTTGGNSGRHLDKAVANTTGRLSERLDRLEAYALSALNGSAGHSLGDLPEDMVIYRY